MWLKTTTRREKILCSLTHGAASPSSLLPKTFQEKLVMDECIRNNEIAKQSFPFGRKAKILSKTSFHLKTRLTSRYSQSLATLASFSSSSQHVPLPEMSKLLLIPQLRKGSLP